MDYFNSDALRKWKDIFTQEDTFPLHIETFLITSILPLAYIDYGKNEEYILVEVNDIKKFTSFYEEGITRLKKIGYAKEVVAASRKDTRKIAIGKTKGVLKSTYYFMGDAIGGYVVGTVKEKVNMADDPEMKEVLQVLEDMYNKYSSFCAKIKTSETPEKVFTGVNSALKVAYINNFTPQHLLSYLTGITAMVYDWVSLPTGFSGKDVGIAKTVLSRVDGKTLIKLIPFFVNEYPNYCRKGWEQPTIGNFLMTLPTTLKLFSKHHKPITGNDTDTL